MSQLETKSQFCSTLSEHSVFGVSRLELRLPGINVNIEEFKTDPAQEEEEASATETGSLQPRT